MADVSFNDRPRTRSQPSHKEPEDDNEEEAIEDVKVAAIDEAEKADMDCDDKKSPDIKDGSPQGKVLEDDQNSTGKIPDHCPVCGDGGELLCCDACPMMYHMHCLKPPLRSIPRGHWFCPHCAVKSENAVSDRLKSKPRPQYREADDDELEGNGEDEVKVKQPSADPKNRRRKAAVVAVDEDPMSEEFCPVCGLGGEVICCDSCPGVYHLGCLDPPLETIPKGDWFCPKCENPMPAVERFLDKRVSKSENGSKGSTEYLIKWKWKSYLHASWVPASDITSACQSNQGLKTKLKNFLARGPVVVTEPDGDQELGSVLRPEWTTVDRIIAVRSSGAGKEYLVKWKELGYEEASWELLDDIKMFKAEIGRFHAVEARWKLLGGGGKKKKSGSDRLAVEKRQRKDFTETPDFLSGGSLHPYQLEGLNWLRFAWQQSKHVILADEMGLGKTIQSIAFLACVKGENPKPTPHIVVAPLSTLRNWEREFSLWAPEMNVIMYVGSGAGRAVIRQHEFYFPAGSSSGHGGSSSSSSKKSKRKRVQESSSGSSMGIVQKQDRIKFDVLLTSYEMINIDTSILKGIQWECLIVDEGHRLKNKESKLFQTLQSFSTKHRTLLTGTPLQNNLDELFMLMHFLDPLKFASLESFQSEFRDLSQEEQVGRLHRMLAPHMLRRLKKDVLKEMPPKKELIVRVELSPLQRTLYKAVLTRNYEVLARNGGQQLSLSNVVMELRKVCGHPYLFDGAEPSGGTPVDQLRNMVEASGKLALLDTMATKLKESGHRILIYSQFTRVLDILEDWLNAKSWGYERIDGSIGGAERQVRIDRYNAPSSSKFCFLLSTRAGGLGINLATADTVVIFDSDWNPHADLQAMARAHRLGQKGIVMIYRLITRGTIEERMMQMTKKKMVLEHLVVGRMKSSANLNQEELDDILRYGARELFEAEEQDSTRGKRIQYDDAAIDRLLDRTQAEHDEESVKEVEESEYLKAFKVANFELVDEDVAKSLSQQEGRGLGDKEKRGAAYWDDLLRDQYTAAQIQQQEEMGKGKRARKQVNYTVPDDDPAAGNEPVSDAEHQMSEEESSSSDGEELESEQHPAGGASSRLLHKSKVPVHLPQLSVPLQRQPAALMEGHGPTLKVLGFNSKQRATFLSLLLRYGLGDYTWREFHSKLRPKSVDEIKEYAALFLSHMAEEQNESPVFGDGVPKEGVRVHEVLQRIGLLHLIHAKVSTVAKDPTKPLFAVEEAQLMRMGLRSLLWWKAEHDVLLLRGMIVHGYGRWQDTAFDPSLNLQAVIRKEMGLPPQPALDQMKAATALAAATAAAGGAAGDASLKLPNGDVVSMSVWQQEMVASRRVVEWTKKRLGLLFKALNLEYQMKPGDAQQQQQQQVHDGSLPKAAMDPTPSSRSSRVQGPSTMPTPPPSILRGPPSTPLGDGPHHKVSEVTAARVNPAVSPSIHAFFRPPTGQPAASSPQLRADAPRNGSPAVGAAPVTGGPPSLTQTLSQKQAEAARIAKKLVDDKQTSVFSRPDLAMLSPPAKQETHPKEGEAQQWAGSEVKGGPKGECIQTQLSFGKQAGSPLSAVKVVQEKKKPVIVLDD